MEGSRIDGTRRGAVRAAPDLSRPLFVGSEIYRRSTYGGGHPLAIPRVSTAIDLCRALGWLPEARYLDSPRATPVELTRFHEADYVAAVLAAEAAQQVSEEARARYNIGVAGNPVFPEIFSRPATACGASILAGRLLAGAAGEATIYSPAGGTHHGRPERASGFCYFNDPVLAILALLDGDVGRVFYLDLDAHHGDGVQDAFAGDPRVFTLSVHEAGRWPMRPRDWGGPGGLDDRGAPAGREGWARNLPVPPGFNDSELAWLVEAAVLPLIERFEPEVLVVQCAADALEDDPQSRLSLSNLALWRALAAVLPTARRRLVLGGGGYNPWSVGRAWAGVWATLNGFPVPERLPAEAEALLRALTWRHRRAKDPPERWFTALADPPRPGAIRDEVRAAARAVLG